MDDSVPESHEGDAEEEAESPSDIRHKSCRRNEEMLSFDRDVRGHHPHIQGEVVARVGDWRLHRTVHHNVLLVSARLPTALPWVQKGSHLGHVLHETGSMDPDCKMRRGALIGRCLEVQEAFAFAGPSEVLTAIKVYCGDLYGYILARLDSDVVKQMYTCWLVAVKDVWGLTRATHTANARYLSRGHSSLREDLLARWPRFYRSLLTGPSAEVAAVAQLASADARSTTAANNRLIFKLTGNHALVATADQVRRAVRSEEAITEPELATAQQLEKAIEDRWLLQNMDMDCTDVQRLIDEIC
jgi:hypothetical protein